jgi:HEAT repeat protein
MTEPTDAERLSLEVSGNSIYGPAAFLLGDGNTQTNFFAPDPVASRARWLESYLPAAARAAREQPYPGVLPGTTPPLAAIYVRQRAKLVADSDWGKQTRLVATALHEGALRSIPADEILVGNKTCVVLAGPGGGKTSLLRSRLATGADRWLSGRGDKVVPVLVTAAALVGLPLAQALAAATTADLAPWLLEGLPAEFFSAPPSPGAIWLVLIDGLDEVADADSRRHVLQVLADMAQGAHAGLYRFVVATRPLPEEMLDALGPHVPRYDLEPFQPEDLLQVARSWFDSRNLPNPEQVAKRFLQALSRTRLGDLARNPLMASLLCQLHAAAPDQPIPASRGQIYHNYISLLHKHQYASPSSSNSRRLCSGLERYGTDAIKGAEHLLSHLPTLIAHLAAERLSENHLFALDILESRPEAQKPPLVPQDEWRTFLGASLRHSGLLTVRAGEYVFLHQTLLEYLAASYAISHPHTLTLQQIFNRSRIYGPLSKIQATPSRIWFRRYWLAPLEGDSFVGFLLDIASESDSEAGTVYLNRLATRGGLDGCRFIANQAYLGTRITKDVLDTTADAFNTFALNANVSGVARMEAAHAVTSLGNTRAPHLFHSLVRDITLTYTYRQLAVQELANLGDPRIPDLLHNLARDITLTHIYRQLAVQELANLGDPRISDLLHNLARDTTLTDFQRTEAIRKLANLGVPGVPDLLYNLARDTTLARPYRTEAIRKLANLGVPGVPGLLGNLARDTTLNHSYRTEAAYSLAELGDPQSPDLLHTLAHGTNLGANLDSDSRMEAANMLAAIGDPRVRDLFHALAHDETLHVHYRRLAARQLASLGDSRVPDLLHTVACDDARSASHRTEAATMLAVLGDSRATDLFHALTQDTRLNLYYRQLAAQQLASVGDPRAPDLLHALHEALRPEASRCQG